MGIVELIGVGRRCQQHGHGVLLPRLLDVGAKSLPPGDFSLFPNSSAEGLWVQLHEGDGSSLAASTVETGTWRQGLQAENELGRLVQRGNALVHLSRPRCYLRVFSASRSPLRRLPAILFLRLLLSHCIILSLAGPSFFCWNLPCHSIILFLAGPSFFYGALFPIFSTVCCLNMFSPCG